LRLLPFLLLGLAACGGGGTSPAPKVTPAMVATAGPAAIGKGTLTLRFPPTFAKVVNFVRKTSSSSRRPAYVNPTAGNLLDIYVGGTLVLNLDGVTPSDSGTVVATSDGTQTFNNVPVYSAQSDIAVIEWDSTHSSILALGENPSVSFSPGTALNVALTLQMNATGFAISQYNDGSRATALNAQNYIVGAPGYPTSVYFYPIDPLGGYTTAVPATGYGGVPPSATVTGTATLGDNSRIGAQPTGSYLLSYATANSGITTTASTTNPAYFYNDTYDYPELNALWHAATVSFTSIAPYTVQQQITLRAGPKVIHEYALPTQNSGTLYAIVAGPDGNLWGGETNSSNVYKITTAGVATEYMTPTPNAGVFGMTAGSDGNLWFAEFDNSNVAKMVPGTGVITEYPLPQGGSGPSAMATAPDNRIWVVEYYCSVNSLAVFTPGPSPTFSQYSVPQVCSAPELLTFDGTGNIWFAEGYYSHLVQYATPGGSFPLGSPPALGAPASGMTTGSDGNIWLTEANSNVLARITVPGDVLTEFPLTSIGGSAGAAPTSIITGPDGDLWFSEPGVDAIARVVPGNTPVVLSETQVPTENASPHALTIGPDGNIWFTEDGSQRDYVGVLTLL
jgi:streptogramin lyase